jgi:Cu-processing system permease protein
VSRGLVLFGRLLGLFEALAAAQLVGFGASGLVIFSRAGREGLETFVVLVLGSLALTAIFLGLAALIATTSVGRRGRALAIAVVGWFVAVVVFDVAALGLASMLRSGTASRVLIGAVLVNPVDTVRTATLLAVEGDAAFGAASLAFFRVLGGTRAAAIALATSGVIWIVVPALVAWRRLEAADL